MNTRDQKAALRRELKVKASVFSEDAVLRECAAIWKVLENMSEFRRARNILIYMDMPGEVMTREFIDRWSGFKRFVLPLVAGDDLVLKEYSSDKLVSGYRGIMEPSADAADVLPSEIDLAVIPGVAFCADGRRMGRGRGFYDRLLPSLRCPKIGVCYSFRLLADIPCDPWDVRMDRVISASL